jgi:hypothetical protein
MDSLLNNLTKLLNRETIDFLSQRIGVSRNQMVPAIESVVSFLFRLVERADTFNYYELASIFTRNGRDTNTPDKIIAAIKLGNKHEALSDARKLLNVLLRDDQETFQSMLLKQHSLTNNQAEEIIFIGAVLTNVLLGYCMITQKMNMRAITRNIKSEAVALSDKMTIEMKELNRQLTTKNMMIDETKPLREEPQNNTMLYAGLFAGLLILISVLYKACSGTMH